MGEQTFQGRTELYVDHAKPFWASVDGATSCGVGLAGQLQYVQYLGTYVLPRPLDIGNWEPGTSYLAAPN